MRTCSTLLKKTFFSSFTATRPRLCQSSSSASRRLSRSLPREAPASPRHACRYLTCACMMYSCTFRAHHGTVFAGFGRDRPESARGRQGQQRRGTAKTYEAKDACSHAHIPHHGASARGHISRSQHGPAGVQRHGDERHRVRVGRGDFRGRDPVCPDAGGMSFFSKGCVFDPHHF